MCSLFSLQLGNHDQNRMTKKKGAEFTRVLNMLLLLLPGTPTTYQGEEMGMLDTIVTFEETLDPAGKNAGPVSLGVCSFYVGQGVAWGEDLQKLAHGTFSDIRTHALVSTNQPCSAPICSSRSEHSGVKLVFHILHPLTAQPFQHHIC